MNIVLSKKAAKVLQAMDNSTKARIIEGIKGIPQGDIKPLVGYSDGRKRLRIGKYRAIFIYTTDNQDLYVLDIGSRGDIYK